jgi:hypothetical protein
VIHGECWFLLVSSLFPVSWGFLIRGLQVRVLRGSPTYLQGLYSQVVEALARQITRETV